MIFLVLFIIILCAFTLPGLVRQKQKKEIAVFLGLTLAALYAGYIYFSDILVPKSIFEIITKVIGAK